MGFGLDWLLNLTVLLIFNADCSSRGEENGHTTSILAS